MAVDKRIDSGQLDSDLTSVANAIRAKSGGSGQLAFPSGFVSEIGTIPGRDPNPVAEENDVIFIDYDGTIRYSYSAAAFANLSALPANPTHDGLTAQGWNWTLADAKTYVASFGGLVIGQSYVTSDGKTKLYMLIPSDSLWAEVRLKPSVSNGVVIDWDDGTTTTTNSTSTKTYHHDYSTSGYYVIKITVNSGTVKFEGAVPWEAMTGSTYVDDNIRNRGKLYKIEFGKDVTSFGGYIYSNQINLEIIIIPTSVILEDGHTTFSGCCSLKTVVLPKDFVFSANNNGSDFYNCQTILYISLPKNIINTEKSLRKSMFTNCYCLRKFSIPANVENIGNECFYGDFLALRKIIIPENVTNIGSTAFSGIYPIEIHMRPTTPPALANKNAFNSLLSNGVIYVPYSADHSILNDYQTASNWVDWASKMQEEPQ